MKRQEYFIEIMKTGRVGKKQMPISKKGKIKILPKSQAHIHQLFADYGWMVTTLVPTRLNKCKEIG